MIIYHNPRCSKSRAALELLKNKGIHPTVVLYLESPPTAKELAGILKKLGVGAKELIRFNDEGAKELRLSPKDKRSESEWISLMARNPVLIERPIVVKDNKAAVGRPPENILQLL